MKKKEQGKKEAPDKNLIEAQLRNEAGDDNRTQTPYEGNIEVTALSDPPVRRRTRSMPRTSKAVADALVKKPRREKQETHREKQEKSRSGNTKTPSGK